MQKNASKLYQVGMYLAMNELKKYKPFTTKTYTDVYYFCLWQQEV